MSTVEEHDDEGGINVGMTARANALPEAPSTESVTPDQPPMAKQPESDVTLSGNIIFTDAAADDAREVIRSVLAGTESNSRHTDSASDLWAPSSPSALSLLMVENPARGPMTPQLHRRLMLSKLKRLIAEAGQEQAREALEMSAERLSEMAEIAVMVNPEHWATAILNSDLMQMHLNQIDWGKSISQEDRVMLSELYEDQCLQSLLEVL